MQLDPIDAQDLALELCMRWIFEVPREALDELADAVLAWTDEPELDDLLDRAVASAFSPALEQDLREALNELAQAVPSCEHHARRAVADLDASHAASELVRAFFVQCASEYAHDGLPVMFCLCCIEEGLKHLEPARGRIAACEVAQVAVRDVDLPEDEVAAALRAFALNPGAIAGRLATDARREAMRRRIDRIAALSSRSLPLLSQELRRALEQSRLADPADDELWATLCHAVAAEVAAPELN